MAVLAGLGGGSARVRSSLAARVSDAQRLLRWVGLGRTLRVRRVALTLRAALDAGLAGHAQTQPYGCEVKY